MSHISPSFKNSFIIKVKNKDTTSFWHDPWCGSRQRLCAKFPMLYALEINKDCKVSDRWHHSNNEWCGNWSWWIAPRGRAIDDLLSLTSSIEGLKLDSNDSDKWFWTEDVSGKFKVNTLVKMIQNIALGDWVVGDHHNWNSWIPRKGNICVWRASLNRLPTRDNLVQR
ncbi:hypothetical protein Tco_0388639, partial [Tanacetum coccineum]